MKIKNSNCLGYALYKLGLQEKDEMPSVKFSYEWLWSTFKEVEYMKDADAVWWGESNGKPWHMAVVDKKNARLSQRRATGALVTRVSLKESGAGYKNLNRHFLKLR